MRQLGTDRPTDDRQSFDRLLAGLSGAANAKLELRASRQLVEQSRRDGLARFLLRLADDRRAAYFRMGGTERDSTEQLCDDLAGSLARLLTDDQLLRLLTDSRLGVE